MSSSRITAPARSYSASSKLRRSPTSSPSSPVLSPQPPTEQLCAPRAVCCVPSSKYLQFKRHVQDQNAPLSYLPHHRSAEERRLPLLLRPLPPHRPRQMGQWRLQDQLAHSRPRPARRTRPLQQTQPPER